MNSQQAIATTDQVRYISFRGSDAANPLPEGLYRGEVIECLGLGKNSMGVTWYLVRIVGGPSDGKAVRIGIRKANASQQKEAASH